MTGPLTELPNAPEPVKRFHTAFAAVSRASILHELLTAGPAIRTDLAARLDITGPSVRKALNELVDAGYATYTVPIDSNAISQGTPHGTVYTARRENVMADLAAVMVWLNEEHPRPRA